MVPCVQIVNFNSCSMILNKEIEEHIVLEMSSSWNFPAQASPSYEGSELSQAEL